MLEELRCACEQVRNVRHLRRTDGVLDFRFFDDEAAADRKIDPSHEDRTRSVIRREAQAVAVEGERLVDTEPQIVVLDERNLPPAVESKRLLLADPLHLRFDLVGIDAIGRFTGEAQQYGAIGSVAAAGQRERSIEVDADTLDGVESAFRFDRVHEAERRAHRPDRVRARRSEADLEEVEGADEHAMRRCRLTEDDTSGPPSRFASSGNMKQRARWSVTAIFAACLATAALAASTSAPDTDAGWQAYRRGDYAQAFADYQAAASKGDRLAQFNVAMMLLRGEGAPADVAGGIAWLTRSANAGMAQAQYQMGLLAESGTGMPRSLTEATAWWQKAAEQGHTQAQVELATQYFLGRGAPKDWKLAAKWYEAAAEGGDVGAQYIMGSFYEHGDGVAQSLQRALRWYTLAAQQGDIGAAVQAQDVARRLAETRKAP
jgi:uncharacterized protein